MVTIQGVAYPTEEEAARSILDVGNRMYVRGMVASNDGNISQKIGPDVVLCTPTGVSKGFMTADMLVKMDLTGKVLHGTWQPSSEIKMHLRVFRENPEIMGVVHAHPLIATSYAIAGIQLDGAILTEAVLNLGVVPIAPYANPGTEDVPNSVAPFVRGHNAVLLANHGALTWGKSVLEAYYRMESLEHYAGMLMYTTSIIGRANPLSCEQVQDLLNTRERMGVKTGGAPPCSLTDTNTNGSFLHAPVPGHQVEPFSPQAAQEQAASKCAKEDTTERLVQKVMDSLRAQGVIPIRD